MFNEIKSLKITMEGSVQEMADNFLHVKKYKKKKGFN
jgi:hypothetical protein